MRTDNIGNDGITARITQGMDHIENVGNENQFQIIFQNFIIFSFKRVREHLKPASRTVRASGLKAIVEKVISLFA